MKKMVNMLDLIEIFSGVCCMLYYGLCVTQFGSGESFLYVWLIIGVGLMLSGIYGHFAMNSKKHVLWWVSYVAHVLIVVFAVSFLIFAGLVLGDIHGDREEESCDYVIILGAAVYGSEPSPALQQRIDMAYCYLLEYPDAIAVGTGGKATGDQISEGACIAKTLLEMGISPDRICYEEESTTTAENMKYAMEMIPNDTDNIAIVSDGFHLFRASVILSNYSDADLTCIASSGVALETPHFILREYIVFVVDLLRGNYRIF